MPTRFQPKLKVQSISNGFLFSKTDTGGSSGVFASPKPEQPKPDRSYKKIQLNPAKTSQIRRDLVQIQLDLVVFSQIWPNPSNFQRKNADSNEKNADCDNKMQISATFFQILVTLFFFLDFNAFFYSDSRPSPIDAQPHLKPTQPIFSVANFRFLCPLPNVGGLSPCWVQNQPSQARGQP